jgi:hypothetical protein
VKVIAEDSPVDAIWWARYVSTRMKMVALPYLHHSRMYFDSTLRRYLIDSSRPMLLC